MDTRETAYNSIYKILEEGKPSHVVLKEALENTGFDKRDKAFITRLTEGTIEQKIYLDYCIDAVSKVKVRKQKPLMRNALRMGTYQLFFMDSVPDSAAVNETVKLIRKKGLSMLSGFANGVLRTLARERERLRTEAEQIDTVKYSCPDWIYEYLSKTYGIETTRKILRGLQQSTDMTVRVNLSKADPDELINSLSEKGIEVKKGKHHPYALHLNGTDNLANLNEFINGLFQVQDESSMFVCERAGIKPDDLVVDVCAAPGGKTLHAADIIIRAHGKGKVISRDISDEKLSLIKDNVIRSGFGCIETEVHNALAFDEKLKEKADVVLCDAPCSGLGIIAKKPDIKYNMSPEKQDDLVELQMSILTTVSGYVRKGGTLMYSTCTINKSENEDNVKRFCERSGFELIEMRQLLPGVDECDGFFYAKLRRP